MNAFDYIAINLEKQIAGYMGPLALKAFRAPRVLLFKLAWHKKTALAACLWLAALLALGGAFPARASASAPAKDSAFIPWAFLAYAEPSFRAETEGAFSPQEVDIVLENGEGWALIKTGRGEAWVYLLENLRYIDKYTDVYDEIGGGDPVSVLSPQTVEVLRQSGGWMLIKTWMGEKWINPSSVRQGVLLDVPAYNQRHLGYPTGCETVSLAMMINYTEDADVDELIDGIPRSIDPNLGFRGDPGSEDGFTIFPQALTALTEEHLGAAHDMSGCEISDLKAKLNENKPVVAWINGLGFNVHAICLTGYNEDGFFYNDPWRGTKDTFITYRAFYGMWDKEIFDGVFNVLYSPRKALSY